MSKLDLDTKTLRNVAANVRRLRGRTSLASLGRSAGTSAGAVRDIEHRVRMPGAGLLRRISMALGVTMDELVSDPPKKSRRKKSAQAA